MTGRGSRCAGGIVAVMMMAASGVMADFEIVRDGQPRATIYISEATLSPQELTDAPRRPDDAWRERQRWTWAVNDLVDHLRRMSGAEVPVVVVDGPDGIKEPAIVLGDLADMEIPRQVESGDGFRLRVTDHRIDAAGQARAGHRHAVYALLRELGCDWIMPGDVGIVAPESKTITVQVMDRSDAPAFLARNLWVGGYKPRLPEEDERYEHWKQRMFGGTYEHPVAQTAGHFWDAMVRMNRAEFDANPEMYALVRDYATGTLIRRGPQVESTHPRVRELIVERIRKTYEGKIAAGEWTSETAAGFPIGPADGEGYSLSTESQLAGSGRIDPITGREDVTDLLILLGNQVLEEIHDEYPNAIVGFYNYSVHADYPARYKPHPNIGQIFAPINFSRFHGVGDHNATDWAYYRDVVEQWATLSREQGNPLMYRGYSWNLADNILPFSKVRIWGEELPWYRDLGFVALNVQAIKSWSVLAPSDYVFMRLAWNPDLKWQELLAEYCDHAYGPAGETLNEYWLTQINRQHDAGQQAGSYHAMHLIYDRVFVDAQRKLLDKAFAAAGLADAQRKRIEYVAHGLEMMAKYLDFHDAMVAFDFAEAHKRFLALHEHWQAGYDRNTDIVDNVGPRYLDRFLRKFAEMADQYSSGSYRIVYRIADELPTLLDPTNTGEMRNVHSPDLHDADFIRTKTFSTTWDAQGLAAYMTGATWYRIHFTLPPEVKAGDAVGLFLGGFNDEAQVWVNGKIIGSSGRGFSKPTVFDLTDGLQYEGDNVIALKIRRNGLNELGVGGLIRPSFLFTGPRLEQAAPKPFEQVRVLPGAGEVD